MKHNRFSKWIERLLVLLPLFYVAISSAYVIFNKNAKDSYYGENINEVDYSLISNINQFEIGNFYCLDNSSYVRKDNNVPQGSNETRIYFSNPQFLVNTTSYDLSTSDAVTLYITVDGVLRLIFYSDGRRVGDNIDNTLYNISFTFEYLSDSLVYNYAYNDFLYSVEYNNYSFLNNVLPYSMSEFIKLGFGKLDFTSWFTNIFMNVNTNNVYVQFVNSYLNYFLMVECVYFIPMIIYWFIHFGESVVERFIAKGDNW